MNGSKYKTGSDNNDVHMQGEHNADLNNEQISENGRGPVSNDESVTKKYLQSADVNYKYGWCNWHPGWIQRLNTPQWLLVFMSLYTFIQGVIVNGFVNVAITTLERRFSLPSTKTGLIASTYDIAVAILVVFVSYYGGRGHKARWLSYGCVIMAVGSIIFALPHFTTGLNHTSTSGSAEDLVCLETPTDETNECKESETSRISNYFYVFILSQVLHGIGCTPLYCIGVTLIDESVTEHQSALYLGIFFSIATLGPAIGYVAGGALLSIYTDIDQIDVSSLELTPKDTGWVGAWWIGFLAGGIIAFFVAVPIGGYPTELPSTPKIRAEKSSQAHASSNSKKVRRPDFGDKLSDFPRAIKYLLMNPTFVFLVLVGCAEAIIVSGVSTFGPKVIETQLGKTAGQAALLMGACTVVGAGLGTFIGGYVVKRWKLKVRGMINFSCCTILVVLVAQLGLLIKCPQEHVVGVNADYNGNIMAPVELLVNDCNAGCGCTRNAFNPVCGDNGLEYYDPCFAGCTASSGRAKSFSECSCLSLSGTNTSLTATYGKCARNCGYLPLFLALFTLVMLFHFMASIPGLSAVLRCVPESQRSLAMGVQWICIRLLGSIPGPIVFGAVIDSSCILWQENCKGGQGSCFLYNSGTISWKIFLAAIGFKLLSLVFFLVARCTYRSSDDDDEKEKEGNNVNMTDKEQPDIADDKKGREFNRLTSQSSQLGIVANAY